MTKVQATSASPDNRSYASYATTIVDETPAILGNLPRDHKKALFLGKTPLACEEQRPPFPDALFGQKPSEACDIMPAVQHFLDQVGILYPLICDSTLARVSGFVKEQGFQEDLNSCLMLLLIAITKAYKTDASVEFENGLSDFQRAIQLRSRLSAQLSLEYVQTLVLSALFLLKKCRLLDFSLALHAACTTLHTVIKR